MAIQLTYDILPSVTVADSYWIIGQVHVYHFDETAFVEILVYLSEDARNQLVPGSESPIDKRSVMVGKIDYDAYFSVAALTGVDKNPVANAYEFLITVEEPRGLADTLRAGTEV
jgi:hypothetical protein